MVPKRPDTVGMGLLYRPDSSTEAYLQGKKRHKWPTRHVTVCDHEAEVW